jgi:hypothetical protein
MGLGLVIAVRLALADPWIEYPLNCTVSPQQARPMGDTPFRRSVLQRAGDWLRRGAIDGHSTATETRANPFVRLGWGQLQRELA